MSENIVLKRLAELAKARQNAITATIARTRLQGRLLDLEKELLKVRQKKESALEQRILKLEKTVAAERINLNRAKMAVNALSPERLASTNGKKIKRSYQIVRQKGQGTLTVNNVGIYDRLLPGDTVIVN
jgi:hypothetical protein